MVLKIAIQGDPIRDMHPEKETTFILGLEAELRGHNVKFYRANDLFLEDGKVMANVYDINHQVDPAPKYIKGGSKLTDLSTFDVILTRQAPPVNQRYLATTYILERIQDKVLFVNRPSSVRNCNAKITTTDYPEFIVPYIISNSLPPLKTFFEKHGDIILKPLNDFGGSGIFRLNKEEEIDSIYSQFRSDYNSHFMAQKYIPKAVEGDKRIIMFDGEPVCSILRVPKDPSKPANISSGATVEAVGITENEKKLCAELSPMLKKEGLFFTGIDLLGGYLTEVNVVSVGTVKAANDIYKINLAEIFWDKVEAKLKAK